MVRNGVTLILQSHITLPVQAENAERGHLRRGGNKESAERYVNRVPRRGYLILDTVN